MAELKLPRLLAAAKEFNVGQDTLIDFLVGKGFSKDELKPTSKLSEEMYRALQHEFQGDKAAKMKSDQVDLPKGAQAETRKKKEEEEVTFRKEKEEKKTAAPAPVKEEPAPVVEEKPAAEEPAPVEPEPKKAEEEVEVVKVEAPEFNLPKVVDKIDLSAIDSSTRPKKVVKKKSEQKAEAAPEPKPAKKAAAPTEEPAPVVEAAQPTAAPTEDKEDDAPPVIENIRAEKNRRTKDPW
ncbi:MAG: hypothetical protein NVV59_18325 [Chitinophagaceae bacterium]|nr:hypothetical protein [Chitinophagaceae bacterium]